MKVNGYEVFFTTDPGQLHTKNITKQDWLDVTAFIHVYWEDIISEALLLRSIKIFCNEY